jgi:hypothetical protein
MFDFTTSEFKYLVELEKIMPVEKMLTFLQW